MLSKAQSKYIRSLSLQKFRKENNVFVAEGDKIAREWLVSGSNIQMIVAVEDWAAQNLALIAKHPFASVHIVSEAILQSVSTLQTANKALLVVGMPAQEKSLPTNEWCLVLDDIQDPGNVGTIIRIADWFGIDHIVASPASADFYNPKVVQAAMGGHLRVHLHHVPLLDFLSSYKAPVLAAALNGDDIYKFNNAGAVALLIGNESKGLSTELLEKATKKVTIPRQGGAESLNAAVSTGILCALLKPC